MKTLQEEAFVHQNDMSSVEAWSRMSFSDEERNVQQDNLSLFGPCCANGCQYCRPNCHEQPDSSKYF